MNISRVKSLVLAVVLVLVSCLSHSTVVQAAGEPYAWVFQDDPMAAPDGLAVDGNENTDASVIDSQGDMILTGYTDGNGAEDFYTVKISGVDGSVLWRRVVDGPAGGEDWATEVAVDAADNIVVAGHSLTNHQSGGSNDDILTIKYDSAGNELWRHTYNGPENDYDYPTGVSFDRDGNVYIAGFSNTGSLAGENALLYRINSGGPNGDGTPAWTFIGQNSLDDRFLAVATGVNELNPLKDVVVATGHTKKCQINCGDGNATNDVAGFDFFTVKFDANSTEIWRAEYDNSQPTDSVAVNDKATIVALDSNGDVIVSGTIENPGNRTDALTIKYSAAGDGSGGGAILWQTSTVHLTGNNPTEPRGLAVDAQNRIFVTGYTFTNADMDDFYTARLSSANGTIVWEDIFDNPYETQDTYDASAGIALDETGGVYVTGSTHKSVSQDYDFLTVKYHKESGNVLWSSTYDGPTGGDDQPVGIAVALGLDQNGDIYVGGYSEFTFGATTELDFCALKYLGGLLDKPSGLIAQVDSANATQVNLSWQDNADIPNNEDFYCVERCAGWDCSDFSGFVDCSVAADSTTYTDTGLTEGTWYSYRVRAMKSAGPEYSKYTPAAQVLAEIISYPAPTWLYTKDDAGLDDMAYGVAAGPDNNPVAVGMVNGLSTQNDYYTVKLDRSLTNTVLWEARYNDGNSGGDVGKGVTVDSNNDVLISGFASLDSGVGFNTNDIYTMKYIDGNNTGPAVGPDGYSATPAWAEQYAGPGNDDDRSEAIAALRDGSDNAIVIGYGKNSADNDDVYAIKYAGDCPQAPCDQLIWAATPFDSGGNDYPTSLAISAANDVAVGGEVGVVYDVHGVQTDADIFVGLYGSTSGAMVTGWPYIFDGLHGVDGINSVATDSSGNVYAAGYVTSTTGDLDWYINKFSPAGAPLWGVNGTRIDGGINSYDEAVGIVVDPNDDEIVVAGTVTGQTGSADFRVIRYTADGVVLWQKDLDRAAVDDYAMYMAIAPSGDICLAGETTDGAGLTSDIMAIVYDHRTGALLGSTIYDSTYDDYTTAITSNSVGEFFISGYSGFASGTGKDYDFAVVKVDAHTIKQPPSPLQATAYHDSVLLNWSGDDPSDYGYKVFKKAGPCDPGGNTFVGETGVLVSQGETSYTVEGLGSNYETYCVGVLSFSLSLGESAILQRQVTTMPPMAPTNLVATMQDSSTIKLCWDESIINEDEFVLQRCTGVNCSFDPYDIEQNLQSHSVLTDGNATHCYVDYDACDSGLGSGNGKTFSYRVQAKNTYWNTAFSNVTSNNTPPALSSPSSLALDGNYDTKVVLQWNDSATDEDGYKLRRCDGDLASCTPFPATPDQEFLVESVDAQKLLFYRMQEPAWNGTVDEVVDSSGIGNHGTGGMAATTVYDRERGQVGAFYPGVGYVQTPLHIDQSDTAPSVTMMAWVKRSSSSFGAIFDTESTNGGWQWNWGVAASGSTWYVENGISRYQVSYGTAAVGQWQHVAVIFDTQNNKVDFYLDGVLRGGYPTLGTYASDIGSNLSIGRLAQQNQYYFHGWLDDVAVIEGALSASEINAIYSQGLSDPGTVRYVDQTVNPDALYTYQVVGYKTTPCGTMESSSAGPLEGGTTPRAPMNFTATVKNSATVYLSWDIATTSHTGFQLERCQGDLATCINDGNFTDIVAANLSSETTFYEDTTPCSGAWVYRVKAQGNWPTTGNFTAPSNSAAVVLPTVPAPVTASASVVSEEALQLSWSVDASDWDDFTLLQCDGAAGACTQDGNFTEIGSSPVPAYPSGLAALWHMDEFAWDDNASTFEVVDSSGNGQNGTMLGYATTTNAGKYGYGAGSFSGQDSVQTSLYLDESSTSPGATFEAWIYVSQPVNVHQGIITTYRSGSSNTQGWGLYLYGQNLYYFGGTTNYISTGRAITLGAWNHVAISFNPAAGVHLLLNGISTELYFLSYDPVPGKVTLGGYSTSGSFNGLMDEVTVYDRALTDVEMLDRWQGRSTYTVQGLSPGDYTFRVQPHRFGVCQAWKDSAGFITTFGSVTGTPQPPVSLTAESLGSTTIQLSWENQTTSETSLRLARCSGSGTSCDDYLTEFTDVAATLPAGTETFTDNATCEGQEYTYWLRAEKSGSPAGWPTAWSPVTITGPNANAPALNVDVLSESEVDISWSDNGIDEEQYVLSRCQGAACTPVSPTDDIMVVPGTVTGRLVHYRMDEADWSTGLIDSSGSGVTSSAAGAIPVDDAVKGRVGYFDGSNDAVSVDLTQDTTPSTKGFTAEAWVRPSLTDGSVRTVFSLGKTATNNSWGLRHHYGTWRVYNGFNGWDTGVPVDVDVWQHVAVVFDPVSGIRFYKNGVEYSSPDLYFYPQKSGMYIGRYIYGAYFAGLMDEFIAYDHPLSASEISRHVTEQPFSWSYQETGLTPGASYTYRLEAVKTGWCAPVIDQKTVVLPQPPAPENLQVIPNTTGFELLWQDTAGAEDGFTVRRCSGNATICSNPDDNTTQFTQEFELPGQDIETYLDQGICTGGEYTYAVRDKKDPPGGWTTAWNTNGPVNGTLLSPQKPIITSAVQVNEVQIDLEWDNTNMDETGYTVEQCNPVDGCVNVAKGADETTYQAVELRPDTCYTFRVRAEQSGTLCPSLWPTVWSDNATACTPPVAPGTITPNALDSTTVDLVWTDMTETETGTIIERCRGDLAFCCDGNASNCTNANFVEAARVGPGVTHYVDAITPVQGADCFNQEYHYRVHSLDEGLNGNGGGSWALAAPLQFGNVFLPRTGIELVIPRQPEMQADYADIRFYDETAKRELMTYWIREREADHATVWLMTGDNQEISLYYGNPSAVDTSVSDQAFVRVYDDFQGTVIDANRWVELDDSMTSVQQNNGLNLTYNSNWHGLISTETFPRVTGLELQTTFTVNYHSYSDHRATVGLSTDQTVGVSTTDFMHGIYMYGDNRGNAHFRPLEDGNSTIVPSPGRYYTYGVSDYDAKVVVKDAGADYFIRGGIFTDWTLLYDQANTAFPNDDLFRIALGGTYGSTTFKSLSIKAVTNEAQASVDFASAATPSAFDNTWVGSYSPAASVTTHDIGTVSALQTTPGMEGSVALSWTASQVNDEEGFAVERCYGSGCSNFSPLGFADANATSFVDTSVDGSNLVSYRVMAYKNGSCPWVGTPAVGSEINTPPLAQFGLQGTVRNAFAIELSWDDNNTDGDAFEIETKIWNGRWVSVDIVSDNTTSYLDAGGVNPNTEYTYRVRALKGSDQSSIYSNEVTLQTGAYIDVNATNTCVNPSP